MSVLTLSLEAFEPSELDAEQAWIRSAQRGDSAAFGRLIQGHQRPLLRYLCRLTRRDDVGQDLCQETFLRAWRSLAEFDPQKPLAPWLYRIATNLALNFLQRRSWRFLPLRAWRASDEEAEVELPDDVESAESLLCREHDIETVQRALARLEPEQRAPLLLFYGEELSCREMAEALDIQESAAKVRLFRARARLKKILEEGRTP